MSYKGYKEDESYIERACGAASSLGKVVGRTVNWISVSYRNRTKSSRNYDSMEREERILSKLHKVKKRLHKIERNLQNSKEVSIGKTYEEHDENGFTSYQGNQEEPILSITQGLSHPDPEVRLAAAARAVKAGTFSEIYFLILLLNDPVSDIRKQAWYAIRKITGKNFDFDPKDEETDRKEKIEVIRNWWKKALIDKT